MFGKAFNEEEQQIVEANYGLMSPEEIARVISKRLGIERSAASIDSWAKRNGLSARVVSNYITLGDLAREIGVELQTIYRLVLRWNLPHRKGSSYIYFKPKEANQLRAYYSPPPWDSFTLSKTTRLLKTNNMAIKELVDAGIIRGHKQGKYLHLNAEDVFAEMRRRGKVPPMSYAG